ncbi:nucleotide-binding universal stress UspA family protein [Hoeflea halophila]|uniref:Nucleotide-binding universal stress UspA family protein n=1 Tax=Hoeflea halophila TaxID=714899 RepID=A0A286I8P3_9HYPH|nr:universal stress protein [Hoeflea halophila]SOE16498.1 nucleotide-binding universal stress UspA family protein [Hoeflea halophila]
MFERILVAVDGSEGSRKALRLASNLQQTCGSELLILTVFRHHSLLEASMSMVRPDDPESLDDSMRSYAKEVAEEAKVIAAEVGASNVRAFVKAGQPARTIVRFGEEHKADLIIVGSRGQGDVQGFLLGSVSHKVTSLASIPVMVV